LILHNFREKRKFIGKSEYERAIGRSPIGISNPVFLVPMTFEEKQH